MEFVEHKSGNPPAVDKVGKVQYCMYRRFAITDGGAFYMLWPNGAGCFVERAGRKEAHALCAKAETPEEAWGLAIKDKNLMQKFGVDL